MLAKLSLKSPDLDFYVDFVLASFAFLFCLIFNLRRSFATSYLLYVCLFVVFFFFAVVVCFFEHLLMTASVLIRFISCVSHFPASIFPWSEDPWSDLIFYVFGFTQNSVIWIALETGWLTSVQGLVRGCFNHKATLQKDGKTPQKRDFLTHSKFWKKSETVY